MEGGILQAIAAPRKILGVEYELMALTGLAGLTGWLLTFHGLGFLVVFATLHAAAVVINLRDPDAAKSWIARLRVGRARAWRSVRGNLYAP